MCVCVRAHIYVHLHMQLCVWTWVCVFYSVMSFYRHEMLRISMKDFVVPFSIGGNIYLNNGIMNKMSLKLYNMDSS
jgi:hypothetical protein